MSADPWYQPQPSWDSQVRPRLVGPADVRSAMFATTRMKVGYEVAEVDAFLDQVEMSMEQMLGEIQALRRRIASTDQANEARMYDIRVALEQLLVHLGGPTGQPSGVIDPTGRDVPLYSPSAGPAPAPQPEWFAPPRGPVNDGPPPAAAQPYPGQAAPPQSAPSQGAPFRGPWASAPAGPPAAGGFPPPPPNTPPAQF